MYAQSTASLIKNNSTKYQFIPGNLKSFDTVLVEVWNESTEGGQTTGYFKKKDLKLIETVFFVTKRGMSLSYILKMNSDLYV